MKRLMAAVNPALALAFVALAISPALTISASFAQAAVDQQPSYVMCRNRKIVRTVRVEIDDKTKECQTTYTKEGSDRVIGSGRHHGTCYKFLNNVRTNLESANWKCKDISTASITRVANEGSE